MWQENNMEVEKIKILFLVTVVDKWNCEET